MIHIPLVHITQKQKYGRPKYSSRKPIEKSGNLSGICVGELDDVAMPEVRFERTVVALAS